MKTIKIGLLGMGNIGTGTYKTLEMNRAEVESTLGTKVEIKNKAKNKGRIEIEYYSMEELERIIEMINRLK